MGAAARHARRRRRAAGQPPPHRRRQGPRGRPRRAHARRRRSSCWRSRAAASRSSRTTPRDTGGGPRAGAGAGRSAPSTRRAAPSTRCSRYVEQHPRGGQHPPGRRGDTGWSFPTRGSTSDFSVPELPRWSLHDKDDLLVLAERVRDDAWWMQHGDRPPTHDDVEVLTDILTGRFATPYDVNAESDDRAAEFDRLTMEQATILRVTRLLTAGRGARWCRQRQDRARPPAGQGAGSWRSGPQVRSASRCSATRSGSRSTSAARSRTWDRRHRPAFVGHLPRVRPAVGRSRGRSHGQRVLGGAAAGRDGRARRRAARQARSTTR